MIDKKELEKIGHEKKNWEENCYNPHVKKKPERKKKFENLLAEKGWNTPVKELVGKALLSKSKG